MSNFLNLLIKNNLTIIELNQLGNFLKLNQILTYNYKVNVK